ncbi:uncharacterized protein N7459_009411 [Penicillium hispanicum]|uniref:uncharacterized protein n=1 Tax=Penicillium hispanicum TaxID=1080232 RepID=UPI002540F548|nr:uncharacterized protein N7459_009411 [Penicillium hispanicum]KAJ5569981.1 hypothetical protein N7459_009411 [Penicillium hispanicum]
MVNSLWFKWKSFRLPWRKSFLVGNDLAGNTFWEFKDVMNANRYRRIVKFDPKTHYGDVQVTPQWHQWLRYVREHPPSIEEQQQDVLRQRQIKELARLADERWASKPSFLDKPQTQQPAPAMESSEVTVNAASEDAATPAPGASASQQAPAAESKPQKEPNPWARADNKNPGDSWQPEPWTPTSQR